METNEKYGQPASKEVLEVVAQALISNGMAAEVAETTNEAKQKVLALIPEGSEVFTMTSETLAGIGLTAEINETGKYNSVRRKFGQMDKNSQKQEMNRLGAAPGTTVGSVHAITKNGEVLIASNTGSQLPAYAYGAEKVIWVVGAQKIVENMEEGFKRLEEYSLPLESERAKKAYGVPGSAINKVLIVKKEVTPGRIRVILVNQKLGY